MLPTPEAASTAYAEVQSFVGYFVQQRGDAALRLLFSDLKGLAVDDPSSALRSVTGYDLSEWNRLWQKSLLDSQHGLAVPPPPSASLDVRDLARRARLGDLLLHAGHGHEAASVLAPGVAGGSPGYRFRVARAELARKDPQQAAARLGLETEIDGLYGPWFGLRGRLLEAADPAGAARAFALGLSSDPLAEEVACRGRFTLGDALDDPSFLTSPGGSVGGGAPTSSGTAAGARAGSGTAAGARAGDETADWRALCEAARKQPRH
jgi:hypothetical protein